VLILALKGFPKVPMWAHRDGCNAEPVSKKPAVTPPRFLTRRLCLPEYVNLPYSETEILKNSGISLDILK